MTMETTAPAAPGFVAQKATHKNALQLRQISVIGVFGPETDLRALIRLPDGQVHRVGRGSLIDDAQIAGIDMAGVMILRAGRSQRLDLP